MPEDRWDATVRELQSGLLAQPDPDGVTLESETTFRVGSVLLDAVVESASSDPETQVVGYRALCDLLATRLKQGADHVLGCLVVNGEPDLDALVSGLDGMLRPDGTFTPVLPLSAAQAADLVDVGVSLFDVVDPATALLEVAASRKPVTREVAATALAEVEELISRHR